ncbi:MAG: glycosyltransferase [Chloroflexi bacterium]|nr:glycosyltransferase [Chloroflexota bacterium]
MSGPFGLILAVVQAVLGVRVGCRLLRTGRDTPIRSAPDAAIPAGSLGIIVPVLNEANRVRRCLDGVMTQGPQVGEILFVDSGSRDATCDVVLEYARREGRIRLIQAGPAPEDWNGKIWGLHHGERALGASSEWVLTLDADVAPAPALGAALAARARERNVRLLSVATRQHVPDALQGLVHPTMLASLVYRFGRPNASVSSPSGVLANGQCCLIQRELLRTLGGFEAARGSLCEDITLARLAARAGERVGFFEAEDGLIEAEMYADWRDAWQNWPRSLTARDALFGIQGWLGLLEVVFVQTLPLVVLPFPSRGMLRRVNVLLMAMRIGVLCGIARAYSHRPWSFWLSPVSDVPVALALWRSALVRRHTWRDRSYVREKGSILAV